jgi:hypothetical protein
VIQMTQFENENFDSIVQFPVSPQMKNRVTALLGGSGTVVNENRDLRQAETLQHQIGVTTCQHVDQPEGPLGD